MRRDGLIGAELHAVLMQDISTRRAEAEGRPQLDVAVQKTELVRRFPLFAGIEDGQLKQLSRVLRTRYVNAGDIIVRKEGTVRSVYFVASGAVELEAAGQTWRLGPGEMFGQLSILTARRRRTEAKAITPTILLVLDEARFRRILKRSAGLREAVIESARKRGMAEDLLKLPEFAGAEGPREVA
jgi:CPA1 family monovalent cation:H+ antiporter